LGQTVTIRDEHIYIELWTSLASLLRSYTAAHGFHNNRHATVEAGEEEITVRHEGKWLRLTRSGAFIAWTRENRITGTLELTESGNVRSESTEEAMDLAAEAWARELMQ
jgi:hypothetical protein